MIYHPVEITWVSILAKLSMVRYIVSCPVLSICNLYLMFLPMFNVIAAHPTSPDTALESVAFHPLIGIVDISDALKLPLKPLLKLSSSFSKLLF